MPEKIPKVPSEPSEEAAEPISYVGQKPEDQPVVKHEELISYAEMFEPPEPEKPKVETKEGSVFEEVEKIIKERASAERASARKSVKPEEEPVLEEIEEIEPEKKEPEPIKIPEGPVSTKEEPEVKKYDTIKTMPENIPIVPEPEEREPVSFDYKAALNNKDFVEFLALYPDAENLEFNEENKREIRNRFLAFENKDVLGRDLSKLYQEEIGDPLGVKLTQDDLKAQKEFLSREAIENPARMFERLNELSVYKDLKNEKVNLEKEIRALGGEENREQSLLELATKREETEKRKSVGKWAIPWSWRGFLNPKNSELLGWAFRMFETEEKEELRKEMRGAGKAGRAFFFEQIDKQIETFKKGEKFLSRYPEIKEINEEWFNKMRKEFFENFEPSRELFAEMTARSAKKIKELITKSKPEKGLAVFDEAQEYLEKVRSAKETLGIEELKNLPFEIFQSQIDEKLELLTINNIKKLVEGFTIKNKPFDEMRKGFSEYLERENLGSKDKERIKKFVSENITFQINELLDKKPAGYKQKVMLLRVVLSDILYNK